MSICGQNPDILLENRWKLAEQIGQGSFGCVAHAYDEHLKADVAIKFGSISGKEVKYQKKAAKLGISPAVVAEGKNYFVMDYVPGKILGDVTITPTIKHDLGCLGHLLDETHISHKDLHRKNIKLDETGKPIVLDFGMARPLTDTAVSTNKRDIRYRYDAEAPADISKCYERYKPHEIKKPEQSMFEKFMVSITKLHDYV